jgi:hypothetical protein
MRVHAKVNAGVTIYFRVKPTLSRSVASKEAFHEVAQVPEDEQRHIVEMIREAIASVSATTGQ